jgi:hypothetical protein
VERRGAMMLPEWAEVLASALVGVERRPVHSGLSTVDDPALGLLDAAAAVTAYRRAGVRPATGLTLPAPVAEEGTPEVGAAAAARLARLLDQGPRGGDGLDAELRVELLAQWLTEAVRTGRRVPGDLLPALLDAGHRDRGLRPLIVAAGGARAGWLASQRAEWRYLTGERDESGAADPAAWELGTAGQRVAYLAALRATDPAAARDLLTAGWAGEASDERAALLGALRTGLSLADEELLEKALDDRRKEVRTGAAELLGALAGSAYRDRMVARATACVRRKGRRLVVQPPEACDAAMKRDGIVPKPLLQGVGERAWWLEQILARTPVEVWGDPGELLALRVPDDWHMVLLYGLARAAATARDPDWAVAVFDRLSQARPDWRYRDGELFEAVVATLPADRLADRAAVLLRGDPTSDTLAVLLARCPRPWPPALVDALLSTLAGPPEKLGRAWEVSRLCRIAATRLPPSCADRFGELAAAVRTRAADLTDRPESLADDLDLIIGVLRFRHDLLEELR